MYVQKYSYLEETACCHAKSTEEKNACDQKKQTCLHFQRHKYDFSNKSATKALKKKPSYLSNLNLAYLFIVSRGVHS